jgi:sugar diacid utilization regulator
VATLRSILQLLHAEDELGADTVHDGLDKQISEVRLIEDLDQLAEAQPGSLVVLDRGLSHLAESYRLDVAVRRAISRDVAALVLLLPATSRISITATALSRKSGLPLVRLPPEVDLTVVLAAMAGQVATELHLTIDRAQRASEAIGRCAPDTSVRELVALSTRVLGAEIVLGPRPEATSTAVLAVPAVVTDSEGDWLVTERLRDPQADALLEMVLWRLAAEVSRRTLEQQRAEQLTRQSAGEVLLQLIQADRATLGSLTRVARRVGIPVDGWHVIVRVELDDQADVSPDAAVAYEQRDKLARLALGAALAEGGTWHIAQDLAILWLLRTDATPPQRETRLAVARQVGHVLQTLMRAAPRLRIFCGIGTPRAGVTGLAVSATEARLAAASGRSLRRSGHPISFDAMGMRTTLVEWYGSPTVQQSVEALFAPLAELPEARRDSIIDTLGTYLDLAGSIARTAEALHLHRNAVRARVQRALELLDIDEEDADQRLFLHLACRARRPWPNRHVAPPAGLRD